MHIAIELLLVGTSITNFITFLFFSVLLVGLIKTRIASGNTITNAMIVERLALVLVFGWNTLIAVGVTHWVYYDGIVRLTSLVFRFGVGVMLIVAILFIIFKD